MLGKNKQLSLHIGIIAVSSIIILFLNLGFSSHGSYVLPAGKPAENIPSIALPVRLKIPKIGVDAVMVEVGLTPDGAMDAPKGPNEVAWFNLGPRPGDIGSAVISGHYGWKNNIPAVFDNLHKLRKGDKIYVEDEKGMTEVFIVRESRSYDEKADAGDVFGSTDGKAHLNLVTCEGIWNKFSKSYSKRLVVFADKE